MKIAMWSGPRNLSTAMMYSFGARNDCAVWDEPFYAAYLAKTGLDHPMGSEIVAAGEQDAAAVADTCLGDHPGGKPVFYQKHMVQHMVDGFPTDWMEQMVNVFLIRHPARVYASYQIKRENPTLEDLGFPQQIRLFEEFAEKTGRPPVVVDSTDIRADPEAALKALCAAIDLPFQDSMLSWPAGGHKDDGVWAPHWYGSVWKSTGFAGAEGPLPELDAEGTVLIEKAMPSYERMAEFKIKVAD